MKSLRKTIVFSFIAVTFLSSIAFFYSAVHESRKTVRAVFGEDMFSITDRINNMVSEVVQGKIDFLEYVSNLEDIKDDNHSLEEKMKLLVPMTRDKKKDLISLSYLDANGNVCIASGNIQNFSSAPIYKACIAEKKPIVYGPTIDNITNKLSINIAVPVYNKSNAFSGMLLARFDCKFLCEISQRTRIGQTGYCIIIDRVTGNTIGAPVEDDVINQQNIKAIADAKNFVDMGIQMQNAIDGIKGSGRFNVGGVKRSAFYEPIDNTNWAVVIMASDSELIGKLKTMDNSIFALTIIILVVSIVVSLLISRALKPLAKVGSAFKDIASGNADLTKRLEIKRGKKEILDIVNGFNDFVIKLHGIVTNLKSSEDNLTNADSELQASTSDTTESISQIIENIETVNNQIQNQAGSVSETAGAVNQIASNIESLERMITAQSEGVEVASSAVEEMVGNISSVNKSVEQMISSFRSLEEKSKFGITTQIEVNEKIQQIEEQSKMLKDANAAISNIASQTNLLAMNAAIEAAHAGEAGKGFSVVADEIRKLSETSTRQSKTIGDELNKIQDSIETVVQTSLQATEAFNSVSSSIQDTDQILQHIKNAMDEQEVGSKQITDALHTMNDSTSEVKSASAEMAEGNKHILTEVRNLQAATTTMQDSIETVSKGVLKINQNGSALSSISNKVTESIQMIGDEINQFKI